MPGVIATIVFLVLTAMAVVALLGIVAALKNGFSEIIRGLESIDESLRRLEPTE